MREHNNQERKQIDEQVRLIEEHEQQAIQYRNEDHINTIRHLENRVQHLTMGNNAMLSYLRDISRRFQELSQNYANLQERCNQYENILNDDQ